MNRFTRFVALAALAVSATGCDGFSDFVDDPLGDFELTVRVPDAELDLGAGLSVVVSPDAPSTDSGTVPLSLDVERIERIESLSILASDMSFQASTAPRTARGASAPSGVLRVTVTVSGGGAGPVSVTEDVTITDGAVTSGIRVPDSTYATLVEILNSGTLAYTVETSVVSTTDPTQPLSGTFSIMGYTGTIVAVP